MKVLTSLEGTRTTNNRLGCRWVVGCIIIGGEKVPVYCGNLMFGEGFCKEHYQKLEEREDD